MRLLAATAVMIVLAGVSLRATAPEDAPRAVAPILSTEISGADLDFFSGAARNSALLYRLCTMTRKHAMLAEVGNLTGAIADEQGQFGPHLKELAAKKGVPLDIEPDGQGKTLLLRLEKLEGARFDKSAIDAITDVQAELEASLKSGAASTDAQIKAMASGELQALGAEQAKIRRLGI
jgi:hypothetical protein